MQKSLKLGIEQRQQLRLSPQQMQYIRLLEMNQLEFEDEVRHEIEENPALEEGSEHADNSNISESEDGDEFNESAEQMQLADYRSDDDIPSYRLETNNYSADDDTRESIITGSVSMVDSLTEQLAERDLSDEDMQIGEYIIGNLDSDGYLRRPLQSIADDLIFQVGIDVTAEHINDVFQTIRDLEPAGIGATSLQDCLLLQLERKPGTEASMLAYRIINECFDAFSKKHYSKITAALNISDNTLREAMKEIVSLNPKPASSLNGSEGDDNSQHISPDFVVEQDGDNLSVSLCGNIPEMYVSPQYVSMYNELSDPKNGNNRVQRDTLPFVKLKLENAQWYMRMIQQRYTTLMSAMTTIVTLQRNFFITGDEASLRPMILKDIADRTGYDISTISRALNSKYVLTTYGIYSLKFFFSEGMNHSSGEEVSSREIKSELQKMIDSENKKHPLSDDRLCELLHNKGYEIARRTVAKYREQLSLPVARLRKEL